MMIFYEIVQGSTSVFLLLANASNTSQWNIAACLEHCHFPAIIKRGNYEIAFTSLLVYVSLHEQILLSGFFFWVKYVIYFFSFEIWSCVQEMSNE